MCNLFKLKYKLSSYKNEGLTGFITMIKKLQNLNTLKLNIFELNC